MRVMRPAGHLIMIAVFRATLIANFTICLGQAEAPASAGRGAAGMQTFCALAPNSMALAAPAKFRTRYGKAWKVRWDAGSGWPMALSEGRGFKVEGAPEEAARQALKEIKELFGIDDLADLVYLRTTSFPGAEHVRFRQTLNGVEVIGGYLVVHLEKTSVKLIDGSYYHYIELDAVGVGTIPPAAARVDLQPDASQGVKAANDLSNEEDRIREAVKNELGLPELEVGAIELRPAIFPREGAFQRVWKVTVKEDLGTKLTTFLIQKDTDKILIKAAGTLDQGLY